MSRFLGQIRQLGYVVPDIEAAMDYWSTTLGVGLSLDTNKLNEAGHKIGTSLTFEG